MTLKVKISRNGHFIDDSNKYRFIYVPRNISTEKKAFFMSASASIFFPRNGGENNELKKRYHDHSSAASCFNQNSLPKLSVSCSEFVCFELVVFSFLCRSFHFNCFGGGHLSLSY